jgi:hypothetical protein
MENKTTVLTVIDCADWITDGNDRKYDALYRNHKNVEAKKAKKPTKKDIKAQKELDELISMMLK